MSENLDVRNASGRRSSGDSNHAAIAKAQEPSSGLSGEQLARLVRFARTTEAILLLGERGTGKSFLAEWVHKRSSRSSGAFHRVNLAGLDDSIASSELFGYVPGAFTDARGTRAGAFACANHGTLFLDEIGKASLAVQRKLLDVIERHVIRPLGSDRDVPVDVRLIFAANESLETLVANGSMLRDFLPRLGMFRVTVPPLRERPDEIPRLLQDLVRRHAPKFGWTATDLPKPTRALEEALSKHQWPDNVRELEDVVRRLLADAWGSPELSEATLVGDLAAYAGREVNPGDERVALARAVGEAIARNGGNKSKAARELGIARSTLYLATAHPPIPDEAARRA